MFEKRIGITQRLILHPRYNEKITCLELNWMRLLETLKVFPVIIPQLDVSNFDEYLLSLDLDGLILSGGNSLYECSDEQKNEKLLSLSRDNFEKGLLRSAVKLDVPVLGVCRGLQLINQFFGGSLTLLKGHIGVRHQIFAAKNNSSIKIPKEVNSYHAFGINQFNLANGLSPIAVDINDYVEAASHLNHRVLGIMWHPERERDYNVEDLNLIRGHLSI